MGVGVRSWRRERLKRGTIVGIVQADDEKKVSILSIVRAPLYTSSSTTRLAFPRGRMARRGLAKCAIQRARHMPQLTFITCQSFGPKFQTQDQSGLMRCGELRSARPRNKCSCAIRTRQLQIRAGCAKDSDLAGSVYCGGASDTCKCGQNASLSCKRPTSTHLRSQGRRHSPRFATSRRGM